MKMISTRIPFPGFYESILTQELDCEEERMAESLIEHGEAFGLEQRDVAYAISETARYGVAFQMLARTWVKQFARFLAKECDIEVKFEFEEMTSPREYNFITDRLFAKIPLHVFQRMFNRCDREILAAVVKQDYTRRPGFIPHSCYSNDVADWYKRRRADYDHNECCTVIKAFIRTVMGEDYDEHRLFYRVFEDMNCNGEFDAALSAAIDWPDLTKRLEAKAVENSHRKGLAA